MKKFSLFLSVLLFSIPMLAQQNYTLLFKRGNMTPEVTKDFKTAAPKRSELINNRYYRVIQFYQIPTDDQKKKLSGLGFTLLDYLPNNAYIVSIKANANLQSLSNYGIRSLFKLNNFYKLDEQLANPEALPGWAIRGGNAIEVVVIYPADIKESQILTFVKNNNYELVKSKSFSNTVNIVVPITELKTLSARSWVNYVEPVSPPPVPENLENRTNHRSNAIDNFFSAGRHYDGRGVNVALGDDGIIGPHIDYTGRIDQSNVTSNSGNHGDHCAGIIFGGGNLDPKEKGMAPGSFLYVYDPFENQDMASTDYYTKQIRITSTSYGQSCNGGYSSDARDADMQTRQMKSLIHVMSCGNSGTSNCNYGAGAGWGNITGGKKTAKNMIAVGNLDNFDALNSSSSRGPVHDGRIKPDVCAVGTNVNSTINTNTYTQMTGTSMACPGVAGTLAQLYQAYRELNGGQDPHSALMKGVLLNTADDIGNPGPDYKHGYGRINALKAVKVLEAKTYFQDSVSQAGKKTFALTVPANVKQIKAMLYWHDYEANAGVSKALVNNLDFTIVDNTSATILPWVLDPRPNATTLNANATRNTDTLNNVEQITIDNPAAGNYSLEVNGTAVPQGPQTFFVIYQFIYDEITVTYPMGGESLIPGNTEYIRWDAFGSSGTFNVSYSTNNGASWTTIISSAAATARSASWTIPTTVTGQALVRVIRGSVRDSSDANFNIIGVPTSLTINWVCNNYLRFSWGGVTGANGYEVSKLGATTMDSVRRVTGTSVILDNVGTGEEWYSVKAIGPNGVIGRRAIARIKNPGNLSCTSITANFTASDSVFCSGKTVTFTPVSNAGPNTLYSWSFPGGTPSTSTDKFPTVTYNYGGNYNVVLTVIDSVSGAGTRTKTNYIQVTKFANAGTDQTICQGSTAQLQASGGLTYRWSPATGLSDTTISNPVASPSTTTTYNVKVTNASACIDNAVVTVTVIPPPVINSGGNKTACEGEFVTLNATATGASSMRWLDNNNSVIATTGVAVINALSTKKYYVEAFAGACKTRDSITVTVLPKPMKPVVSRTNDILSTSTFSNYQWYRNGSLITGATQQQYTITQGGVYKVTVKDASGCSNTSDDVVAFPSGIEIQTLDKITVYPNPASHVLNLINQSGKEHTLDLLDMNGKLVLTAKIQTGANELLVNDLAKGVYQLRLVSDEGSQTARIIIR